MSKHINEAVKKVLDEYEEEVKKISQGGVVLDASLQVPLYIPERMERLKELKDNKD